MVTEEVSDPIEELQRENELTQRLLEHIQEEAELLKSGKDVPPGEITEGVMLLGQYLAIHARRFDEKLQPEARRVAMDICFEHLDKLLRDHADGLPQTSDLEQLIAEFAQGVTGARARLAERLESLTSKDYAEITYERDYPLSCLVTALPEDAAQRVAGEFTGTSGDLEDLESHIRKLLAAAPGETRSPLRVRCAHEGCHAGGEGWVAPGREGRLALMAPDAGWTLRPQDPQITRQGSLHLSVDFYCPVHSEFNAKTSLGGEEGDAMVAAEMWESEGGRVA